jgi:oxygen-independent coproporphyrinogen-3 oxidase
MQNILFSPELLKKYDINGPRYTSYPSADRFSDQFSEKNYVALLNTYSQNRLPISLYVHIPFCSNICYYCACNKVITKDTGRSKKYIKYLIKELQLVTHQIKPAKSKLPLSQLHLGGGTPTFLSMEEMGLLINEIKKHFDFTNDGEFSIEIDPRNVSKDYIFFLRELGFNRVSIGVQDFNVDVQKAIHRIQTFDLT